MAIIKAQNTNKVNKEQPKDIPVSLEAQERLAEVLSDSPRLIDLNGTEWEIRALRMGTQWLIAKKCIQVVKAESANFGDIVKQFSTNIPAIVEVLVLALLNDKRKIFMNGDETLGYSDLYKATYDTLMWECNVEKFGTIFLETLQLLDVSFFLESLHLLEIFRESTMTMKTKMTEQK
jgi:hypothetical protein